MINNQKRMEKGKEQKVIERIHEIAKKLKSEGGSFTRSDLAYELKSFGIESDSHEITKLVWQAWNTFGKSKDIENAFTNNAGNQSLVDMYQASAAIDNSDISTALKIIHKELSESDAALALLSKEVESALSGVAERMGTSAASVIKGTAGVERVKKDAETAFEKYTQMVNAYESARCNVQETILVFTELRNDITRLYRQYAMALTDVFGNSIKSVSPDLFDFEKVEWLDVQGMLKQIELQYTSVSTRCSSLMNEIESSFRTTIQSSLENYRVLNDKQAGLLLAGINMLGHYLDASSKTAEMSSELIQLRSDMRRDATHIKGDVLRLAKIYKSMNDVSIPQAELFYRYAGRLLEGEVSKIIESLYKTEKSSRLKEERETLLQQMQELERQISDANSNISYFENTISECETILSNLHTSYNEARESRPKKPMALVNLLTFGNANKTYNRDLYEWNCRSGQLVKRYEDLKVDLKLDNEDLQVNRDVLERCVSDYEKAKRRLSTINQELLDEVKASPEVKQQMIRHLKDMVKLLHVSKSIAETKLDEKDIHVVSVKDLGSLSLPEKVEHNIDLMTQVINDQIPAINNKVSDIVASGFSEVVSADNLPIESAVNVFQQWVKVAALAREDAKSEKYYAEQMEQLKVEFQMSMQQIDNRSAFLRDVAAKVNTACSDDEIKQGLFSLTGTDDEEWSDSDWEAFLSGDKELQI
jgi:hypothetical protein